MMPLQQYPFAEKYGWVQDRYGLSWQLMLSGGEYTQKIIPYLMFVGEQHGKAEEAINLYTSLFDNSSIQTIDRYGPDEGEIEGSVKHARFTLNGQQFMALESAAEHNFTFTEAISLFVNCENRKKWIECGKIYPLFQKQNSVAGSKTNLVYPGKLYRPITSK
jgi:predicted 3-demethylubiquinone-9 3-methyltransferase (glyoxalase superfamily)